MTDPGHRPHSARERRLLEAARLVLGARGQTPPVLRRRLAKAVEAYDVIGRGRQCEGQLSIDDVIGG